MKKYIFLWVLVVLAIFLFAYNYKPLSSAPNYREEPAIVSEADQCMKDIDCRSLSELGYYEARGEPEEGIVAVMAVALNRVNWPTHRWPSTLRDVIKQHCEFTYNCDGSMKKEKDLTAWNNIAKIAYKVQNGEYDLPKNLHFYHSVKLKHKPIFAKKFLKIETIGNHVFYECTNKYC